ncbi:transcription antitermination factor NusB [Pseudostreptobacillus hongkongensis]|uniref:transcription antitermination factor NusB n=1 Tax=Pseudostreptobacillus hongkongensis TaxID=1162717 RepID=UPI0028D8696A|nr:transcription antitermination factor NusB [Pseudostreptobacillus hongkongensis]
MTQREIRNEIFKLLFEHELMTTDLLERHKEVLDGLDISKSKKEFFNNYILKLNEHKKEIVDEINKNVKGWSYSSLGNIEKVILQMSFYEILIEKIGEEIAINEAVELAKTYGDENTKGFINGILANLIKK